MSSINLTCDSCGREVLGCTFVNGMKFCAKCYQETFGDKNHLTTVNDMWLNLLQEFRDDCEKLEKEKTDLEAKLAEKEKELLDWRDGTIIVKLGELEQQLTEKDVRIKELEETNKVLSNELIKNGTIKQDHLETCCGIPIFEIPKLKEENEHLKQQLAEKDKLIDEYVHSLEKLSIENADLAFMSDKDKAELLEKVLNKLISICECIYSQHYGFALIEIEKFIKEIKGETE